MKIRLAARNINLLKKGLCYTLERSEGRPKLATWGLAYTPGGQSPPMLCLVLLSTVTPKVVSGSATRLQLQYVNQILVGAAKVELV